MCGRSEDLSLDFTLTTFTDHNRPREVAHRRQEMKKRQWLLDEAPITQRDARRILRRPMRAVLKAVRKGKFFTVPFGYGPGRPLGRCTTVMSPRCGNGDGVWLKVVEPAR